jgi:hypothetical protein
VPLALPVYVLCTLTSLACAYLLLRHYRRRRVRILLWSGLCFVGITVGNVMLIVDAFVFPQVDLSLLWSLPTLAGLLVLIRGLIADLP